MAKQVEFPMTQAGKEKLKEELDYLTTEKREAVKARIKRARSFCDFSEDSEFEAALTEQETVEDRITLLKQMIQHAKIIEPSAPHDGTVDLGRTVTFKENDSDETETYTIVGRAEADPLEGKISDESPIAQALYGHKVNDDVDINLPGGKMTVTITDIQ